MVPPADEVMNRVMIIMARFITCLTQRGDSIGGDQQALHPLLAWWAILFALSMLARYQPDTWTDYLDVDKSPAVPVETLLDRALLTCPELLLHAI